MGIWGVFVRSGALSGLGLGPFRNLVGVLSHGFVGMLSETYRGETKQQARNAKQALRALSFCLHGFVHTRRVYAVQK